jgi:hypothetical protein
VCRCIRLSGGLGCQAAPGRQETSGRRGVGASGRRERRARKALERTGDVLSHGCYCSREMRVFAGISAHFASAFVNLTGK